jgi:hypothetical protein
MNRLVRIGNRYLNPGSITRIQRERDDWEEADTLTVFFRDGQAPWGFAGGEAAELSALLGKREAEPVCPDCGCKMAHTAGPGKGEHGFICLQPGCLEV